MKRMSFLILITIPLQIFAGNMGLGLIIGSPTGFSGKFILARQSAVEINAGWSFIGHTGFHFTGDYQHLFPGVVHDEYGKSLETVVPYLGIGGRAKVRSTNNSNNDDTEFAVGVRMGGGIEYSISQIGIFLELYPVVNVVPSTDFDFEGGLGGRYYF